MSLPFSALYDTSGARVEADVVDVGNALVLSHDRVDETPSRKDGVAADVEATLRLKGCEIVHGVLTLCGVSRVVICTAQIYLHRYYCQRSVAAFNYKYVALGVSYLALKTEETNITEEELIPVFCRFLERAYLPPERSAEPLDWVTPRSNEFELWWEWLVCLEMDILIAFGFIVHVPHPHKLMLTYVQKLELTDLMEAAWSVLNDCYLTTACVRYPSEVMACGAIFYVARERRVALPEDGKLPWWELFGATQRQLYEFSVLMQELYVREDGDFDFTRDVEVQYRNERPDGVKRPHPVLLHPPKEARRGGKERKRQRRERSRERRRQSRR